MAWVIVGLALQLVGIGMAIWALVGTWRHHSDGRRFLPELERVKSALQRLLRRKPAESPLSVGSGRSEWRFSGVGIGTAPLEPDADVDTIRDFLRRRMPMYDEDMAELRSHVDEVEARLTKMLTDAEAESRQADVELQGKVAHVAVGSIRLQMAGLILVGLGSVMTVAGGG